MQRFILLGLVLFVALQLPASAQKVQNEKVTFPYLRLPLNPLPDDVQNYTVEVEMPYAYDYMMAVEEWEREKARLEEQHEKDMEAYNSKKTGKKIAERMFLGDKKPVLVIPPKPIMRQKIFEPSMVASSLKLDGYNKSEENAVKFTVTLYGYERTPTELKSRKSTNSKTKVTTTYYQKVMQYKHPMRLMAMLPSGEVVFDELIAATEVYGTKASKEATSTSALNRSWSEASVDAQTQDAVLRANMIRINAIVNDLFGFSTVERTAVIKKVKPKKFDYPEFDEGYVSISSGYRLIDTDFDAAIPKIEAAIEQWESALKESDPDNKKARINAKVTMGALLNLAEAYTWLSEFTKAEECLSKFFVLKPGMTMKGAGNSMKAFVEDQRTRVTANAK